MMTASAVLAASLLSVHATPAKAQWFFGAPAFEEPAEVANAKAQKRRAAKAKKATVAAAKADNKKSSAKAADKNAAPAFPPGLMQLVVSIAKQRVTVFSDGKPVAESPVSTGQAGHPTPLGIFSVISKARHHVSNIYSGAPMPYMHRITWSGIAMHEGMLPGYPASHGCIRMPGHFVSKLFASSKIGMRVVITREPAAPFEFASARLPVPKAAEDIPLATFDAVPDAQRVIEAAIAKEGLKDGNLISEIKTKTAGVQFADAKPNDVTGTLSGVSSTAADTPPTPAIAKPIADLPKRKGPVQIFVSRKEGKMYVRQGFGPLFDVPVKIDAPEQPWGTHIFTIMDIQDGKARWTALTIPSGFAVPETKANAKNTDRRGRAISQKEIERREKRAHDLANAPTADVALERFELPQDAIARIAPLLAAGSSLIVSDNGLSDETGADTDFIVATR